MKQKALFKLKDYGSEFGGSLLSGKRKFSRPLSTKNPLKIVLRADMKATYEMALAHSLQNKTRKDSKSKGVEKSQLKPVQFKSLLKYRKEIDTAFAKFAQKFGVKIYEKALVSNHIHFVAQFGSREQYKKFIRALCGTLSKQLKIKWHLRPWSRIVAWGRALKTAIQYTIQNHREAIGAIPYQARPDEIKRTRQILKMLPTKVGRSQRPPKALKIIKNSAKILKFKKESPVNWGI